jgi:ketosteroid isomerase-like protein
MMHSKIRLITVCLAVSVGMTILAESVIAEPEGPAGQINVDSAAVAGVVNQFHDALEKGDSATALSLLASDAVVLESGRLETRNEYRSHHLSSDIQFSRAIKAVRAPLKVVVVGDIAWTSGTSTAQGDFNGRAVNTTGAESMVLSRSSGGWKIRSIHWSSRARRPAS